MRVDRRWRTRKEKKEWARRLQSNDPGLDVIHPDSRSWRDINVDLSTCRTMVTRRSCLRLYQRVLIPHHEAGNGYWRDLAVN
jgi:hypothetical protein